MKDHYLHQNIFSCSSLAHRQTQQKSKQQQHQPLPQRPSYDYNTTKKTESMTGTSDQHNNFYSLGMWGQCKFPSSTKGMLSSFHLEDKGNCTKAVYSSRTSSSRGKATHCNHSAMFNIWQVPHESPAGSMSDKTCSSALRMLQFGCISFPNFPASTR